MPGEWGGREWRGGWRGRERPRWWPAGEAWPPAGPPWRRAPRRFLWRVAVFFGLFVLLVGAFVGLVAWLVASALGGAPWTHGPGGGPDGPSFFFPFPLVVAILAILLVGAVASGSALRRIAAPLAQVMEAAGRVAAGDYAARVRPRGPRDVRALGESFNAMAERLERAEAQRRQLLADVTHELRTPLAVVQAELEALLDGVRERDDARIAALLDETRVLARLVEDLRTLSLAEAGALALHREPADLGAIVEDAVVSFRARADAAGVVLRTEAPTDLPLIDVDPVRVRETVANLVENAIRHTPRGGSVVVAVAGEGGALAVSVRDSGSGIAADALPHVFDRFVKGAGSRGSGLGLAIARDLVEAHGGAIGAASDGQGAGTTVRFTLPLAAPR